MASEPLEKLQTLQALRMRRALASLAHENKENTDAAAAVQAARARAKHIRASVAARNDNIFDEVKGNKDPRALLAQIVGIRNVGRLKTDKAKENLQSKVDAKATTQARLSACKAVVSEVAKSGEQLDHMAQAIGKIRAANELLTQEEDIAEVTMAQFVRRQHDA